MNKKLEDAAKKYIETGRGFDMDSLSDTIKKVIFKDGAEWALREAIGILKVYKLSSNAIHELEQILSSKGENNGTK